MIQFLTRAVTSYRTTGAVFPSGSVLARAMTEPIRSHTGPKRVLEVGPGTGAFTKYILAELNPGDVMHLVEINPDFAELLERTIVGPFRAANAGIEIRLHNAPIETADVPTGFDYIVCGLPFNNFPLQTVSRIFRRMMSLLQPGGELTYFEYVGMKAVKWPWVGSSGRDRLRRRIALEQVLERRWQGHRQLVVRNMTPARAVHLTA